jgi:hypothetical protein
MEVQLDGEVLVGATTGLVLDGTIRLINNARVSAWFEVSTTDPKRQSTSPSTQSTVASSSSSSTPTLSGYDKASMVKLLTNLHNTAVARLVSSHIASSPTFAGTITP